MKKLIFFLFFVFFSHSFLYAYAPYSEAGDTALEHWSVNEGADWMFGSNTDVKRSSIGEAVIGIVLPSNETSPLYAVYQGFAYVQVFIPPLPDYQYDIKEILAYEYQGGFELEDGTWQSDSDPFFEWTLKVAGLDVLGYSIAFDEIPDEFLDVTEAEYQTPDFYLSDGKHTFYVVAKNTDGNFGQYGSFDVWVDTHIPVISDTLPQSGSITSNPRTVIQALLFDATSGIDVNSIKISITTDIDTFTVYGDYDEETGLLIYTPTEDWPEGIVTVQLEVKDKAGNDAVAALWSFTVATTAPLGWVLINEDAPVTELPQVNLSLYADSASSVTDMMISWDGVFDTEMWEPYASSKQNVNIPAVAGEHTVYVKFKDSVGNESEVYTDSIVLILAVPDTFITEVPPAVTTYTDAKFVFKSDLDDVQYQYKLDNNAWSIWVDDTEVEFNGLEEGNHYFQVRSGKDLDGSGDISNDEIDQTPAAYNWTIGDFLTAFDERERAIKYYENK